MDHLNDDGLAEEVERKNGLKPEQLQAALRKPATLKAVADIAAAAAAEVGRELRRDIVKLSADMAELSPQYNARLSADMLVQNSALRAALAEVLTRVAALEARSASTDGGAVLTDGGTWNASKVFHPGAVATHSGALWVANEVNSNARPGQSLAWRLMGKTHAK